MAAGYQVIGIILVTVFMSVSSVEGVKCYMCNHSPKDNRTEEWCTAGNFRPEMAQTRDCHRGCERVTQKDLNGELEHVHRNCYTSNDTIEDTCRDDSKRSYKRQTCICTTDLCNEAVNPLTSPMLIALVFIVLHCWTGMFR